MADLMAVLSNAVAGQEEPYNDWYDNVHAVDVLTRLNGYTGIRRYRAADRQLASAARWGYLALWDVAEEVGLAGAVDSIRELRRVKRSGKFDPKDTLYRANPAINGTASTWYRQIDRVDGELGPDTLDDHILAVFSNSREGQDEAFHAWYRQHCRDVVTKLAAFKSAARFIAYHDQLEEPDYRHLLVYRIPAGCLQQAQDQIVWQREERATALAAGRAPLITTSSTMIEPHAGWWFSPISDRFANDGDPTSKPQSAQHLT